MQNIRIATIGRRMLTSPAKAKVVPSIRLTGQWMADAGFSIGDKVEVHVSHEKLTIIKSKPQQGDFKYPTD